MKVKAGDAGATVFTEVREAEEIGRHGFESEVNRQDVAPFFGEVFDDEATMAPVGLEFAAEKHRRRLKLFAVEQLLIRLSLMRARKAAAYWSQLVSRWR